MLADYHIHSDFSVYMNTSLILNDNRLTLLAISSKIQSISINIQNLKAGRCRRAFSNNIFIKIIRI